MVFLAGKLHPISAEKRTWPASTLQKVVDSTVFLPVGRPDPNIWNGVYHLKHPLNIGKARFRILEIKLIAAQWYEYIIHVKLTYEMPQRVAISPDFGVARIPVDRMQRMTVLLRILGKTQSKVKRHRIAENQYGLGNAVCLGLYDLSCQRICK